MVDNKELKTDDRKTLCDLFIQAGYPIYENVGLTQVLSIKPHIDQDFVKFVQMRQMEVLTLKSLCRICVRNILINVNRGCSIKDKVYKLPLPKLLLTFMDFNR